MIKSGNAGWFYPDTRPMPRQWHPTITISITAYRIIVGSGENDRRLNCAEGTQSATRYESRIVWTAAMNSLDDDTRIQGKSGALGNLDIARNDIGEATLPSRITRNIGSGDRYISPLTIYNSVT